jgi:hypothetical protein
MMAIAKRSARNPWATAALVLTALFVLAVIAVVVLYINFEKQTTAVEELRQQNSEVINSRQWSSRGALIGAKSAQQTYIGLLLDYIDDMVSAIIGAPEGDTNAEVKVQSVNKKIADFMAMVKNAYPDIGAIDTKTVGLLGTMARMKDKLDSNGTTIAALQEQLIEAQKIRDKTIEVSNQKVQDITAERDSITQQAQKVQNSYDQLKALMQKSADDQVKTLYSDLEKERDTADNLNLQLRKTEAELKVASDSLKDARDKLAQFTGQPDNEPQIRQPDGEVLLVDEYSKIVHINIGSEQHVYPGLTFGVYEQNVPIPKDGKGKGEIEVFNIAKNMSTARITKSDPMNPILKGDVVANLVWSKDQPNIFVVSGEFDLDGNGTNDPEAANKIKALIENWGGKIEDAVSVNTTFVVLGTTPTVLERPTYDQLAIDPLAMEKYEASLKRLEDYKQVLKQAEALNIPILNYERFLYLIGYKSQSTRPGAFSD